MDERTEKVFIRMRDDVADSSPENRTRVEMLIRNIRELRERHAVLMEKTRVEIDRLQKVALVRAYRDGDARIAGSWKIRKHF